MHIDELKEIIRPTNGWVIFRTEEFAKSYLEFIDSDVGKHFSDQVNFQKARLDKNEVSYRLINYWDKEGLLVNPRPDGKGWRKFSLMDILWIYTMRELRKFNFSIKKIRNVKDSLRVEKEGEEGSWGIFEFYVSRALLLRMPVYLIVFSNGDAIPLVYDEYARPLAIHNAMGNHISIKLNDILQKFYPDRDLTPIQRVPRKLDSQELEILMTLRFEEWDSINIRKKDGTVDMIEISTKEDVSQKIVEILDKGDYQKIEILKSDGKIQCIKRKELRKIKK